MMSLTVLRRALVITGRVTSASLAVLGLLVCAAALFLWVRGASVVDVVERIDQTLQSGVSSTRIVRLSSGRGVLAMNVSWSSTDDSAIFGRVGAPDFRTHTHNRSTMRPDQVRLRADTVWQKLGFNAHSSDNGAARRPIQAAWIPRTREAGGRIPYWLIVGVSGAVSLVFGRQVARLRRRDGARRGLCPGCGYDLRASTGRCPECGETIPPRAAPAGLGAVA